MSEGSLALKTHQEINEIHDNKKDSNKETKSNKEEKFCLKCKINFSKKTHFTVHNASVHSMILVIHDILHTKNVISELNKNQG